VLHYVAQRATPADPFGPYIGQRNFDLMRRAFTATSEDEVLSIAEQLRTPYLLTAADVRGEGAESLALRLHRQDGSAEESTPQLGHFRLLAEGPEGGVPLSVYFSEEDTQQIPYKLFEIVRGALLEAPARPAASVLAVVPVRTKSGRRFSYAAFAIADADGYARLRVPYSTDGTGPAATDGPYTVVAGDRRWQVDVPEAAVVDGAVVRVGG
jgi:asparagine N-glycosylation enzyme membrane subunit Stt3